MNHEDQVSSVGAGDSVGAIPCMRVGLSDPCGPSNSEYSGTSDTALLWNQDICWENVKILGTVTISD